MSAPPPPSRNGNPKREDPNSKRARNAEFEARAAASDRSVERRVSNSGAVPHTAISASAGSGKTFQLAHRYIRLLALDVPPGRICALTFTRKAAGEIFDNIVRYLREAAAEERPRRRTAGLIGLPALTRADFLRLLRGFVDGLPQARIGTLDSFTVGVLRAFPLELGLPPAFQIMDSGGPAADRLLREVLAHVFTPRRVPASAQRAFLEAYKQATFGREEKGLCGPIADFIARHRDDYLTCPAAGVWGVPERIWPNGLPWAFDADREAHARDLDRRLAAKGWPARALGAFREVACAAGEFDKTRPWADAFSGTVAGRLFDALPALARGRVEIDYSRKTGIAP